jgi:parallel beta-helix repeat protein
MKKLLVVGVIGLFLGLAVFPVINVSTIAFTTSNKNKYTPKVTDEKLNKIIFNDFPMRYRYITENGQIHTIIKSRFELLDERSRYREVEEPTLIFSPIDGGNHPPIYINGNENFTYDNGVTSGSGTENDPYIIENWIIVGNGSVKRGIYVRNTDDYFIIRNCITSNFLGWGHVGIEFKNVINGKIEDTEMYNNHYGVFMTDASYIAIVNCTSHDNYGEYATGIRGIRCSNIKIISCKCYNSTSLGNVAFGIHFEKGNYIFIENTWCYNNEDVGIEIFTDDSTNYSCVYNTIKDCKIFDNLRSGGIVLWSTSREKHKGYNLITGCEIYNNGHWPEPVDNADPGITIWNLHNNIIENCDIHHNGDGVYIVECSNNIIRNCSIYGQWQPAVMGNGIVILGWQVYLNLALNNEIENCNIYNQDCGIWNTEGLNTRIYKNNISYNNYIGIGVSNFIGISSSQINYNNICGNGFMDEDGYGLSGYPISFVNARNNWWDSEKGPSRFLFPYRGDRLVKLLSIVQFRPWLTEPINDAGVQ